MEDRLPKVGLLPLMLELYDAAVPELKPLQASFAQKVAEAFKGKLELALAPVCNTREQVDAAVAGFEAAGTEALMVLHLSYAPSLISASALTRTRLPLLLLNTTPDSYLDETLTGQHILENHGIHGAQDLANILLRAGKRYQIISGALDDPALVEGAIAWARVAAAAQQLKRLRVGLLGNPFEGMGDFSIGFTELQLVAGPQVVNLDPREVARFAQEVSEAEVETERQADLARFTAPADLDATLHTASVRAGLGLKQAIKAYDLDAFAMHFMAFNDVPDMPTVPFLGVSKLQAEGLGYAGEGDVACASLVATVMRAFGGAMFTEMFCPDWQGDTLLMAHMGECNPALAGKRARLQAVPFKFGDLADPVIVMGGFQTGPATLANLVAVGKGSFRLTIAEVDIPEFPVLESMTMPHFKLKPRIPVGEFLTAYSQAGGSHHSALIPGERACALGDLADLAGFDKVVIG